MRYDVVNTIKFNEYKNPYVGFCELIIISTVVCKVQLCFDDWSKQVTKICEIEKRHDQCVVCYLNSHKFSFCSVLVSILSVISFIQLLFYKYLLFQCKFSNNMNETTERTVVLK